MTTKYHVVPAEHFKWAIRYTTDDGETSHVCVVEDEDVARTFAAAYQMRDALTVLFDDWLTLTEQDYNEGNADVREIDRKVRAAIHANKRGSG